MTAMLRHLAIAAALVAGPAFASDKPLANPDDFTCQFEDLPPMRIVRRDATHYTLRIGYGKVLPIKLYVGSSYATADFQGQTLTFWEDGDSVRVDDVLYKGHCK